MKVILTEDVKNVGQAGQTIKVSEGYGRNFLLPKKLAVTATPGNLKRLEQELNSKKGQAKRLKRSAQMQAETIGEKPLTLSMTAGEGGKLFGSVTAADVEKGLLERGIEIDKRKIELSDAIKTTGTYVVKIKLHPEVVAELKVVVQASGTPAASEVAAAGAAAEVSAPADQSPAAPDQEA